MNGAARDKATLGRWAGRLLRLLFVVGCLAYALWDIEPAALLDAFASVDPARLLAVFAVSLIGYVVNAVRLHLLSHRQASVAGCLAASLLCLGINNVVPAKLGEVAKMFYLHLRHGIALSEATVIVAWERFFDVNVLVVMALASAWPFLHDSILAPLAGLLVLAWLGAWAALRFDRVVHRLLGRLPGQRLRDFLLEMHAHLDARMVRGALLVAALSSVFVWVAYSSVAMLSLLWLFDFELAPGAALVVFVIAASGMALPSSPGGLGVYEAAVVLALGWFGVAKEPALAAALVMHALQFVPTTIAGLLVFWRTPIRFAGLRLPVADGTPERPAGPG